MGWFHMTYFLVYAACQWKLRDCGYRGVKGSITNTVTILGSPANSFQISDKTMAKEAEILHMSTQGIYFLQTTIF